MKKLLSILLAILVLLSGMHLYIATHICRGEVTSTTISFWAEVNGCGMEETPMKNSLSSKCCDNDIDVFSTDNNFKLSSFQLKEIFENVAHTFTIPFLLTIQSVNPTNILITDFSPPNSNLITEVSLPSICIFRI